MIYQDEVNEYVEEYQYQSAKALIEEINRLHRRLNESIPQVADSEIMRMWSDMNSLRLAVACSLLQGAIRREEVAE